MYGCPSPQLPPPFSMDSPPHLSPSRSRANERSESISKGALRARRKRNPKDEDDLRVEKPILSLIEELQSGLKETPRQPRPRPSYEVYFSSSLSGIDDGDVSKMRSDTSESGSTLFIPERDE